MNSILISQADLGRMIAAAPTPREQIIGLGLKVFENLRGEPFLTGNGVNKKYFSNIAEEIGSDVSPKDVGQVIRELGFSTQRAREGFMVVWNAEQILILERALGQEVK